MTKPRTTPTTAMPNLLDSKQMAAHLGVNERHIRRLIAERRIPYIKWGHLVRFDPDEVTEWIKQATVTPSQEPRRYW